MKRQNVRNFVCPRCKSPFKLGSAMRCDGDEIVEGILRCTSCDHHYPIVHHVPRFVPKENYASSFGLEWTQHQQTQLDKFNGTTISHDYFFALTKWPAQMQGQKLLEVGSGSGRFTEVALETGAEVYSFDYSLAVDANWKNNGEMPNLNLFQGDIYNIPLQEGLFDRIFCRGVLQHTPDVKQAFLSLIPQLKSGGEIVVDIYALTLRKFLSPKRMLRRFTSRMPSDRLYSYVEATAPTLLTISDFTRKVPIIGRGLDTLIPIANYRGVFPLNDEQILEWAVLDTFDLLSPRYENRQRLSTVRKWFEEAGLVNILVEYQPGGRHGIWGRGVKP